MRSIYLIKPTVWVVAFLFVPAGIFGAPQHSVGKFASHWSGDRVWVGPEYWANPLQDWRVEENQVVGLAAFDRTFHLLTHQVAQTEGEFEMVVQVRLDGNNSSDFVEAFLGGFRFGVRGELGDYRHALIHGIEWMDAGIQGDGTVILGDKSSGNRLDPNQWINLRLRAVLNGTKASVELIAQEVNGARSATLITTVLADQLLGNLALMANGPDKSPVRSGGASWRFRDWSLSGSALCENKDQVFGPILWTQYTLSRKTLKLLAMMAPVEGSDEPVHLELKKNGKWEKVASADVDSLSRTALFRVEDWDDTQQMDYRVTYRWEGKQHNWSGTIQKDPRDQNIVTMGAFSCDNGYIFPNTRIVKNVAIQDPDILYFAGDQIYESFGGFGITRSPVDIAALDYLRKYWMFGWSWRELLKDRPSVIIPDDHDVFQGNLWGHGGRRIPELGERPSGSDWPKGGYAMDPAWVNAVERTQTASLPDPVDPQPVEQGIGVYFTDMLYGGISFAVLEDRKFKSGPASILGSRNRDRDPQVLDNNNAELLGPRQEAFLKTWVKQNVGDFKVALTQTIFCKVTTHVGRELRPSSISTDSNAWPQNKRNKALKILGENVLMVHGDQHLGALVHQGVEDWEDGPIAFMVPGNANGFPRAWWPEEEGLNRDPKEPYWTGRYFDGLGNRMTVLAVANPEKGSNLIPKGAQDPESIGHQKGSGHGLLKFNRKNGKVTFEMWRLQFDAANPNPGDQFDGFPKTLKLVR